MTGNVLRRLKKLAKRNCETSFTTLKDRKKEIGKGLLREMGSQLGIDPKEL